MRTLIRLVRVIAQSTAEQYRLVACLFATIAAVIVLTGSDWRIAAVMIVLSLALFASPDEALDCDIYLVSDGSE